MAKTDKRMIDRMSGMAYANEYVKKNGAEALEKHIEFRNATYIPLEISDEEANEAMERVFARIYNSYGVAVYKVLNEKFGFGGQRLHQFTDAFNEVVKDIATVDCYGEMLYTFRDYAEEFNRRYDLGIYLDKIEEVDAVNKKSYGSGVDMNAVQSILNEYGYHDAATFLKNLMQGTVPPKKIEGQIAGQMEFKDYPGIMPEEAKR